MLYHSVVDGWLIMIKDDGQPVVTPPDGADIADCPTTVITAMLEAEMKRETMELESEEDKLNEIRRQAWEEGYRDCANEFDICEIDDFANMVREKNPYNKP
jgi:hypothetical protein